ncbi:MAG TPA: hypothetical protein VFS43_43525 [Polyangiaceae bacterium]|nr:hypothetical protein [Polyangiaceae bacterium]
MAHAVQLFVGPPRALGRGAWALGAGRVVALAQGFAALACDRAALYGVVARGALPRARRAKRAYFEGDWHCEGPALDAFGAWLSAGGAVAYLETAYFGGAGDQGACAWRGGVRVYGPRRDAGGAVNDALAAIGVARTAGDEFASLGLADLRSNDGARPEGAPPAAVDGRHGGRSTFSARPRGRSIRRPRGGT